MTIFKSRVGIKNYTTGQVYAVIKFLAAGSFGEVYRVTNRGKTYAMKVFNFATLGAKEDKAAEVGAYKIVSESPTCQSYIVCMYESFDINYQGQALGIVILEFMTGGDLNSYVEPYPNGIPPLNLIFLIEELLIGLTFIHSKGLAHQDIKPANLMTDKTHKIFKIGDMGGGCGKYLRSCSVIGSGQWISPEFARIAVIRNYKWTRDPENILSAQKADIWAMGVVFWEMAFGNNKAPIRNKKGSMKTLMNYLASIRNQNQIDTPRYNHSIGHISGKVINNILFWMLQANPNNRETAANLLKYLRDEMSGCKVGTKTIHREDIKRMAGRNPDLDKYLNDKGYNVSTTLSVACSFFNDYLASRLKAKTTADIKTRATSRAKDESTARAKMKASIRPRIPRPRARARARAIHKARVKPRAMSDTELDKSMSCYINNREVNIKDLRGAAKALSTKKDKWWEEANKTKLCQYVWRRLFEKDQIRAHYVAEDIFRGIQMAVQDDIAAGIDPLSKRQGKKAAEQNIMFQSILNVIKHATPDTVDIKALKAQYKNYSDALDKMRIRGKYLSDEDIKKDHFYRRLLSYLYTVLNELDKMQDNECKTIMRDLKIKDSGGYRKWCKKHHSQAFRNKSAEEKAKAKEYWDKYQSKAQKCRDKKIFWSP